MSLCGAILTGDDYLGIKPTCNPKVPSDKIRREFKKLEKTIKNMKTIIGRRCATITLKNKEIESLKSRIKKHEQELQREKELNKRIIAKHQEMKGMLLAERTRSLTTS